MNQEFPISTYLALAKELETEQASLEKETATWQAVRATLSPNNTTLLDNEFTTTFEQLQKVVQSGNASALQQQHDTLAALLKKGAAATLMSTHELAGYNLAMFIKDIYLIHGKEPLQMAAGIVRITVIAGAALHHQKAYAGNGGITSLEQVCMYLALGINNPYEPITAGQYHFCYRIFPYIAHRQPVEPSPHGEQYQPYHTFMRALHANPEAQDMQEKTLLRIMALGWTPFSIADELMGTRTFAKIALLNFSWLTYILPYEHETLTPYLNVVRQRINASIINALLNTFTSDRKIRKQARAFFSRRPHWLLKTIISTTPEKIFDMVRRNEQDLLATFLKHYKSDIIALRNKQGQSVLQYAVQCRSTVENTVRLLQQAGVNN